MKRKSFSLFVLLFVICFQFSYGQTSFSPTINEYKQGFLKELKNGFRENKGQMMDGNGKAVPQVLFSAEAKGVQLFITDKGITYVVSKKIMVGDSEKIRSIRIDENFIGAKISRGNISLLEKSNDAFSNYFNPLCPNGIYNVYQYSKIKIDHIYPGINWIITCGAEGIKYEFEVEPNANPNLIRLEFIGGEQSVTVDGVLHLKTNIGEIQEKAPVSVQNEDNNISIPTKFILTNNIVQFSFGNYNTNARLLIDPILSWSTFFGGSGTDGYNSICIDNNNNTFLCGESTSAAFPTQTAGTYFDATLSGGNECVITKFSATGVLLWSTFYGGDITAGDDENATAIKTDATGNVFVTGQTNTPNFPLQNGGGYYNGLLNTSGGGVANDAFLLKFSNNGTRLFATYVGGSVTDIGHDLIIDGIGNVFVVGETGSSNFPTQNGGGYFDNSVSGNDGFVMKFTNAGALSWSTFFGGTNNDIVYSASSDNSGNIFITGTTNSTSGFPTQALGGAYNDASQNGGTDGFVAKFSSALALNWSTFYGGTGDEYGVNTAIDGSNNLILEGQTGSINFPCFATGVYYIDNSLNNAQLGHTDIYIQKFSNNGANLWTTLFGGKDDETLSASAGSFFPFNDGCAVDGCSNVYISFSTKSDDVTTADPGCQSFYDNGLSQFNDCFIAEFRRRGQLTWASYFGGSSNPLQSNNYSSVHGMCLALDRKNNILATGVSQDATGFTFMQNGNAYYDNTNTGPGDQEPFIIKFKQPDFNAGVDYSHCTVGCTGTAAITVNSPCPGSYTYNWSSGQTTQTVSNLCNGPYTIIVRDTTQGCRIDTISFTMAQGINISPVVSASSCPFTCDGSGSISIPGAVGATYLWTTPGGGPFTTANVPTGLCPGNNQLIVNVPGCGADTFNFVLPTPPVTTITVNSLMWGVPYPCPNQCVGVASITMTGGEGPLSCFWSTGATTTTVDSLCPGVVYTVTATDSMCYTAVVNNIVLPPLPPVTGGANASPSCNCNGSASCYMQNAGPPPYTYQWSNGMTTQNITGLCAGTYSVIMTGPCGSDTETVVVTSGLPLVLDSLHETLPPCPNMCNGVAIVVFHGGVAPINFYWSSGAVGSQATNLCDSTWYYVMGVDACGDTVYDSIFIHQFPVNMNVFAGATGFTCPGQCTGTATAFASGGHFPYTYYWSNGQTGPNASGLCVDTLYTIIAVDACNDTAIYSFHFPHPPAIQIIMNATPSCAMSCVGSITASATGGIPPYSYSWSSGQTGVIQINNCCANTNYTFTVTDACGTVASHTQLVPLAAPMNPNIVVVSSACSTNCNGTATISFTGGTPPFIYYWSNGTYNQNANNLCADSAYYVIITDPGCEVDTLNIQFPGFPPLVATPFNITSVCPGYCNGSASVNTVGGNPPYTYLWSNGQTTQNASNLCAGTYTCVVTDGCTIHDTISVTIQTIPALVASVINIVNNDCYNGCTGSATANSTGGTPPFLYHWSNGQTTTTATGLCAGTYTLIITDPGCSADTVSFTITSPSIMQAIPGASTPATCSYDCNGSASVSTTGGIAPFNFLWSNGATTSSTNALCVGNNWVIVTDPGCSADTVNFVITSLSNLIVTTVSVTPATCFDTCNGAATVLASNGLSPYSYSWSGGQSTTASAINLCGGNNVVTVTDGYGCIAKDTVIVPQPPQLAINPAITQSHCENADGSITVFASGGTPNYTYWWNGLGTSNTTIDSIPPGTYVVTVTDSHNCIAAFPVTMYGAYPVLQISNDTTVILGNGVDLFVTGALNYTWNPPLNLSCDTCTHPHWFSLETSYYCVIGTDKWGCMDTACVEIIVDDNCGDVFMPNAFSPNGDGTNDNFHPLAWCVDKIYYAVYNRWGQKVFESTDQYKGWDGTFEGLNSEVDVYVWYLEATDLRGRHYSKKGNVSLIR